MIYLYKKCEYYLIFNKNFFSSFIYIYIKAIENQLFNCKVIIKNKYINKTYYDSSFFSKSKKEAKNKIADIVYKDLLSNSEIKYYF